MNVIGKAKEEKIMVCLGEKKMEYTEDDISRIFMENERLELGEGTDPDARYVWSEQLAFDGEEDIITVGYSYDGGNRGHAVCSFPRSHLSDILERLAAGQSLDSIDGVVMLA